MFVCSSSGNGGSADSSGGLSCNKRNDNCSGLHAAIQKESEREREREESRGTTSSAVHTFFTL